MTPAQISAAVALDVDRADFEAWAVKHFASASPAMQFAATEIARAGWEARSALETERRAAPRTPASTGEVAGWKLVPVDPTDAMLCAYVPIMGIASEGKTQAEKVMNARRASWATMLAAAPVPPALAALPPSSGWEAGAEAMREAAAGSCDALAEGLSRQWRAGLKADSYLEAQSDGADECAGAIRSLPLPPPPPSSEG